MVKPPTFKSVISLMAGEILASVGWNPDAFSQRMEFSIALVMANPFISLLGG